MTKVSKSLFHNYRGEFANDAAANLNKPLEAGDLYYNTTDKSFRYYNGTVWISLVPGTGGAITAEGGIAIRLINATGAPSVKGTIVMASSTVPLAFDVCPANGFQPIGAVYEAGIANGAPCLVVITGVAEVLLANGTGSTMGNWVRTSITTAGRVDATGAGGGPGFVAQHFAEVGHCLETKSPGTNVLCKIAMHFN
jgi:hypothetical protein